MEFEEVDFKVSGGSPRFVSHPSAARTPRFGMFLAMRPSEQVFGCFHVSGFFPQRYSFMVFCASDDAGLPKKHIYIYIYISDSIVALRRHRNCCSFNVADLKGLTLPAAAEELCGT